MLLNIYIYRNIKDTIVYQSWI